MRTGILPCRGRSVVVLLSVVILLALAAVMLVDSSRPEAT